MFTLLCEGDVGVKTRFYNGGNDFSTKGPLFHRLHYELCLRATRAGGGARSAAAVRYEEQAAV